MALPGSAPASDLRLDVIELLVLPAALAAGVVAMVVARARALARPLPPERERDRPLAPGERLRLRRWERRLRRILILIAVAYLVVIVAWLLRDRFPLADPRWLLGCLALAGLAGAAAQFSGRCPRCGHNLGFQARLTLPARCEHCGGPPL